MQRFDANPDYFIKETSTEDILPGTHKSGSSGTDNKITLGQMECIPVFNCTTAGGTSTKNATILNASMFASNFTIQHNFQRNSQTQTEYLIGMPIKVVFSYANTGDAPTLNVGSTGDLPITVNGQRMGKGAIGVGCYKFRLMPFGDGYSWDCEDNGGIVSIDGGVVTRSDNVALWNDSKINGALTDFYEERGLSRLREKRIGEIYNSNQYWKVKMKGYYGRPIVIKCIGTIGLYDIAIFGQSCTPKLIRLGNESSQVTYKYQNPSSNGADGYLFIKSNSVNISHTIFGLDVYGGGIIGSLEASTQEEYNNASSF